MINKLYGHLCERLFKACNGKERDPGRQKWSTQIKKEGLRDTQHAAKRNAIIKLSFFPLSDCVYMCKMLKTQLIKPNSARKLFILVRFWNGQVCLQFEVKKYQRDNNLCASQILCKPFITFKKKKKDNTTYTLSTHQIVFFLFLFFWVKSF